MSLIRLNYAAKLNLNVNSVEIPHNVKCQKLGKQSKLAEAIRFVANELGKFLPTNTGKI